MPGSSRQAVHVADTDGALSDRYFSYEETVDVLRTAGSGDWIYQPTLRAPESVSTSAGWACNTCWLTVGRGISPAVLSSVT